MRMPRFPDTLYRQCLAVVTGPCSRDYRDEPLDRVLH
jgi:hypothetical protein